VFANEDQDYGGLSGIVGRELNPGANRLSEVAQ